MGVEDERHGREASQGEKDIVPEFVALEWPWACIWVERKGNGPRRGPCDRVDLIGPPRSDVSINQLTPSSTADWLSWPLKDKVEIPDSSADGKEAHRGKQTVRRTD